MGTLVEIQALRAVGKECAKLAILTPFEQAWVVSTFQARTILAELHERSDLRTLNGIAKL